MLTCEYCQRVWDGNAQCPCWMERWDTFSDSEEIGTPVVKKSIFKKNVQIHEMKDATTQTEKTPLELAQKAVNEMFINHYHLR